MEIDTDTDCNLMPSFIVTWLVLSEIFPSSIKGRAVALVGAVNWSVNILVSFTFLDYLGTLLLILSVHLNLLSIYPCMVCICLFSLESATTIFRKVTDQYDDLFIGHL